MILNSEEILRLLLAVAVGGLIGAEREFRDKAAGFRTLIFISLGAALFTLFSAKLGGPNDPGKITGSIITGVGFLGAGAIVRERGRVVGLTTAATIWLTASLGMGVGAGYYALVLAATVVVMAVLLLFPRVEEAIDNIHEVRVYEVTCAMRPELFEELQATIRGLGLHIREAKRVRSEKYMVCTWEVAGSPEGHRQLEQKLFSHSEVQEFQI